MYTFLINFEECRALNAIRHRICTIELLLNEKLYYYAIFRACFQFIKRILELYWPSSMFILQLNWTASTLEQTLSIVLRN